MHVSLISRIVFLHQCLGSPSKNLDYVFPSLSRVSHWSNNYDPNSIWKAFQSNAAFLLNIFLYGLQRSILSYSTQWVFLKLLCLYLSPKVLIIYVTFSSFPSLSMGFQSQRLVVRAIPFQISPPLSTYTYLPPQVSQAFLMYSDLPSVLYFSTHHSHPTPPANKCNIF